MRRPVRTGLGLLVAGLVLLAVAVVLALTPTSADCGSVVSPAAAGELRPVTAIDCAFEHNERWEFTLLAGAPALALTLSGVVVRAARTTLGVGGWLLVAGLVGLASATWLALLPTQPGCGTVFDPTTRAEFRAPYGYTCEPENSGRLTGTLAVAGPAVVLSVGGRVLRRRAAPGAAREGPGVVVVGVALLSVAVVLLVTPIGPVCGSALSPHFVANDPCMHYSRLLQALLVAAAAVALVGGGLLAQAFRIRLGPGGWAMLAGVAGLLMAGVLGMVPVDYGCEPVLLPSPRARDCPAVNSTRMTAVLLSAAPAAVAVVAGAALRRSRRTASP